MPESYGVNESALSQDKLLAGDHPRVQLPVTIESGAGSLSRGTLLGRKTSNGKYAPITPGTTYEDQDVGDASGGAQEVVSGTVGNPGVKPGSLLLVGPLSGGGSETFSDNGDGTLTSDGGGDGTIDYASGDYEITFGGTSEAGDILATYVGSLTAHTGDIGTGTSGGQTEWSGYLDNTEVIKRSVYIYTGTNDYKLHDDGNGNLVGADGHGTINYQTGEYEIVFDTAPDDGETIDADYCSTDGTHVCRGILSRNADATSEDVNTIAYVHGVFNPEGVVWPQGTSDSQKAEIARDCQDRGIYFKFSF